MMRISSTEFNYLTECLTRDMALMLVVQRHIALDEAFDIVYNSSVYKSLQDENTGLYFQSAGYVYSFLEDEIKEKRS